MRNPINESRMPIPGDRPPRLFYATSSPEDPRVTNFLQVRQMTEAFSASCDVTLALKEGPELLAWPANVEVLRFPVPRTRSGNLAFSLRVWHHFRSVRDRFDLVYSRNPMFSLLAGRSARQRHGYEFHHLLPGGVAGLYQAQLLRRSDVAVAISGTLAEELRALDPTRRAQIVVEHDAHALEVLAEPKRLGDGAVRVGYFGKVIPIKGEGLLLDLIRNGDGIEFHVFTPHPERVPLQPSLRECRYLPHGEVPERMREMDFLLLPVVPVGGGRDYSAYTSPLKLFEYAASGGVILASDVPVLREVLRHGENAYLVENRVEAWLEAIRRLQADPVLHRRLSAGAIELARRHTWSRRVESILSTLGVGAATAPRPVPDFA